MTLKCCENMPGVPNIHHFLPHPGELQWLPAETLSRTQTWSNHRSMKAIPTMNRPVMLIYICMPNLRALLLPLLAWKHLSRSLLWSPGLPGNGQNPYDQKYANTRCYREYHRFPARAPLDSYHIPTAQSLL